MAIGLWSCSNETDSSLRVSRSKSEDVSPNPSQSNQQLNWPDAQNLINFMTEYGNENPETIVKINTRLGSFTVRLFEDTPLHRANFIHHIKRGLYENSIFYRVVPNFIVQGGNSDDDKTAELRENIGLYTIPSEKRPTHFHQKGALAMAMTYEKNPDFRSTQFSLYFVLGEKFTDERLDATEREYGFIFPETSRATYKSIGGAPHLDARHTVFGEVIEGIETLEAIANEPRDSGDWPVNDVFISFEVIR